MINYRQAKVQDRDAVYNLCQKYGIRYPADDEVILVAEDETGIIGICGLKCEWKIEPLIAENSMAAYTLGRMVEGIALGNNIKKLYATVDKSDERHINHLEKVGFEITDNSKILMEKNYYG